ncbi:aminopeptidase [Kandleria vitulina]|uniref:Aminopeptidase n=1 Tax=Kandleria vitulina TaxID=1630 RepID=A0A1H2RLY0_9FIRM|nr:aminopeptidase [Kandleria vitulina]SDW20503.1 aminopeptidase [Kandleria vitulina]
MLKKYAQLIVRQGVNLQKGQDLVISADVECAPLVKEIAKEAYKAGARDVIPDYSDETLTRLRYENNEVDYFKEVPDYIKHLRNDYALKHAAIVTITSANPELLKGIDPQKVMARSVAMHTECNVFYDHLDRMIDRWCIVGAPSLKWANKVFPDMSDEEAMEALWNAIYHVTYVDTEDPIATWDKHRQSFENRVKILNEMKIKTLHYTNDLGTDLYVSMNKGYLFAGGGSYTTDGVYSFPNMPTEEIFSSPDYLKTEGIVYASMPLNYNGSLVEDFYIRFKDGRAVEYDAKSGRDILASIIESDEGAHYLGEVALVPYDSPIRETGILFYNTLFDENAACHLALGKGFPECIEGGYDMNFDQLKEKGVNNSLTHVDFMIGTKDLSITAITEDGEEKPIFINGCFAF